MDIGHSGDRLGVLLPCRVLEVETDEAAHILLLRRNVFHAQIDDEVRITAFGNTILVATGRFHAIHRDIPCVADLDDLSHGEMLGRRHRSTAGCDGSNSGIY